MAGFTTRPVIQGTRGVIASGHYISAAIGMHVLETGGNAVDAGVAAGFALNLTKPQSTGIAGEAPILIYRAGDGTGPKIAAINGQGSAPKKATIEWFRAARSDHAGSFSLPKVHVFQHDSAGDAECNDHTKADKRHGPQAAQDRVRGAATPCWVDRHADQARYRHDEQED